MKRFLLQTFGCQMNVHDSDRISDVLVGSGYEPTDEPTLADVIVVNSCSVREKAEHKLMSLLGTFRPLKELKRDLVMVVAGCVAEQEGKRLLKSASHIDLVLGPDHIAELPGLLAEVEHGALPQVRTGFDVDAPRFLSFQSSTKATKPRVTRYVTIMKGCDERCTFCVVPYTRGPERYRAGDEIVAEVQQLVENGVLEITLLGQTVNSWYEPKGGAPLQDSSVSHFPELLRRIAREVPKLARLRYTSPHPRHATAELVKAHAELEVLTNHVHLPVQSGSDRVLKRMLRRYTREHYIRCARALQSARPGMVLSTDIIVGFPGETESDFCETLSLVQEVGFVAAFAFMYSPRPNTPALKLEDDVPSAVKEERLERLFERVGVQQLAHLESLVNTPQQVLIEGPSRDGRGRYTGRTGRNEICHVDAPPGVNPTGQIIDVVITKAFHHSLLGEMAAQSWISTTEALGLRHLPLVRPELREETLP